MRHPIYSYWHRNPGSQGTSAGVPGGNASIDTYFQQVLHTQRNNLLAYWPLSELAGLVANDFSGNERDGIYNAGVLLNGTLFLDGTPAINNNLKVTDIYSVSLRDAFTPRTFTLAGWIKAINWAVAGDEVIAILYGDGNNRLNFRIDNPNILYALYEANNVSKTVSVSNMISTSWLHTVITVDYPNDAVKLYINGVLYSTVTGLGAWELVVSLNSLVTCLGAQQNTIVNPFNGYLSNFALWSAVLTPSEISALYSIVCSTQNIFAIGDSKTDGDIWVWLLQQKMLDSSGGLIMQNESPTRYGFGGFTVALMKTYINANLAAVTQTPDRIVINLGTNDMSAPPAEATFKADYDSIITSLQTKWPNKPIYLAKPMLLQAVPPSTPDADRATVVGWIDDVIAAHSGVYVGIDEVNLEGGDGYVTNFVDSAHYTAAGNAALANLWVTALGF